MQIDKNSLQYCGFALFVFSLSSKWMHSTKFDRQQFYNTDKRNVSVYGQNYHSM